MTSGQSKIARQSSLPAGIVTFLYTDIEGSTRLWQEHTAEMPVVIARHDALLRAAIERNDGILFRGTGDGVCSVFVSAGQALAAAVDAQRTLAAEPWPHGRALRVRMAVHTGPAEVRDGDYVGHTLNRVARLRDAGHGGQILVSAAARELAEKPPQEATFRDLGEHRLKDLARPEHIYQLDPAGLPTAFPPLKTTDRPPTNLPLQPTPFIGREGEVRAVEEILRREEVRLLTLTGPGGTGKTRLSVEVGNRLLDEFAHGIFVVPLTPVSDPSLVAPAVATALDVQGSAGRSLVEALIDRLSDRELLLVLDNFEHVLAAASLVGSLLPACPRLKVLITSRSVLHLAGEREYPVPTLSIPDPEHLPRLPDLTDCDAIALFVDRAQAVKPDFVLTPENARAVVEICRRLDGLPLAIELAAARLRLFPPQALLGRLDHRLKVLTGGARDLPSRQQTLRGAIDWSYSLLDEGERMLFERLSVLSGGWTFEAAEAISRAPDLDLEIDVLDGMEALAERSLIRQEEMATGEPRFSMLETIREYASEQLEARGDAEELRRRHATYYLTLIDTPEINILADQSPERLALLQGEHDNVRAAVAWAIDRRETEIALQLVRAIGFFWYSRGYWTEGKARAEAALALTDPSDRTILRARALYILGEMEYSLGEYEPARAALDESIAILDELGAYPDIVVALLFRGNLAAAMGDSALSRRLFERMLALAEENGIPWAEAVGRHLLGSTALYEGDLDGAEALLTEAVRRIRALGPAGYPSHPLNTLGDIARIRGEYARAAGYYEDSLEIFAERDQRDGQASVTHNLAYVAHDQGDEERARELFEEALATFRSIGDKRGVAECLAGLAGTFVQEDPERAARLFGAAQAARDSMGAQISATNRPDYDRNLEQLRSRLAPDAIESAWDAGGGMSVDEAEALAISR